MIDKAAEIVLLFISPDGSGLLLTLGLFMMGPIWAFIAFFSGGGWFMFWRAMYINNLLAGGGALLLAVAGVGPFPVMVGDAFALLGLGLVGAFVARWMLA